MFNLLDRVIDAAQAREARSQTTDVATAQKSMVDLHPEILDRSHVVSIVAGSTPQWGAYSYLDAIAHFESHVWVRKAIKIIYDNFAKLPLYVERKSKTAKGKTEVVEDHDALTLLARPNSAQSAIVFWQQWIIDMMLGGEEGWEITRGNNGAGRVLELWPKQPHTILIVPDQAMRRYYQVAEYRIDDGLSKPYPIPPEEFIHFKFFNPRNAWRGIAPITAIRSAIEIDLLASAWSRLFFHNSARPDYAIVAPQGITPTERDDLLAKLKQDHAGVAKAHEPIILESGVTEIKVLSFPPKDMEWLEQKQMSRDEIGGIFGVPDILMGYGNDSYDTQDKRTAALRVLFELTIMPVANYRDSYLTDRFRALKLLADDETLKTDYDGVSALDDSEADEWLQDKERVAGGFMTINTYNDAHGLPRVEWGNVWWAPIGLTPVASAEDRPQPIAPQALSVSDVETKVDQIVKALEYGSAEHVAIWTDFEAKSSKREKRLGKIVAGVFEEQRDEVIKRLRSASKEIKSVQDVIDDPFDRDEWDDEIKSRSHAEIEDAVGASGQAALDRLQIGIDFDLTDSRVSDFIKQREQRFAEEIDATTWERLSASLDEGYKDGETIAQLIERVESIMGDRIRSSGETIARTEIIGDMNGGTLEGWRQSKVVTKKKWLAAIDDRTRDTHIEAHKQYQKTPIDIDEDFEVGDGAGQAPGQIGLPEEDINCRCTMTAEVDRRALLAVILKRLHDQDQ